MLTRLAIRDFAIIDRVEVEFEPGLVVITGETGAGKSILVNALHLLLGGRAFDDMIRDGADSAEVEGVFELPAGSAPIAQLIQQGLEDGGALRVRRVIHRSGRNRVFVNERSVSLASLAMLTRAVVDISGQHEHVRLTDEDTHLQALDAFGGLGPGLAEVGEAVRALRASEAALAELGRAERARAEREDYLRFTIERIDAVAPREGEDDELGAERLKLANVERLAEGLGAAAGWLYEQDGSAVELAGRAVKVLVGLARFDAGLAERGEQLEGVLRALEDAARELQEQAVELQADPARLDQVEQRLQALKGLLRSYGPTITEVLTRRDAFAAELAELERLESRREALAIERAEALAAALRSAEVLSAERQRVARRLAERLAAELDSLAMPGARIAVDIEPGGESSLTELGLDRVRLLFSANPGEALRPLSKVASGGELSRVLLALKAVLAEVDPVAIYVFDEVDSGVGGAVAEVIGDRLSAVAGSHQVFCITHLPQIASFGASHYSVHKRVGGGRTRSSIVRLETMQERIDEVARMVGGRRVTEEARLHARDLLMRAHRSA